jgi:hypothetical protein
VDLADYRAASRLRAGRIYRGLLAAIGLSALQTGYFLIRHRSAAAFTVQIRLAYTALLLLCLLPFMRWLYWLPTLGTTALLLFGYCLMARFLSLMPWNLTEAIDADLLRRTFLTPPIVGNIHHGLPGADRPSSPCESELTIAARAR